MALDPAVADPPHILVVDDDKRLRELLRIYLTEQDFRVTEAGDAAEARRWLERIAFDLIVLDIMMPGESGLDLTRSLRAAGMKQRNIPILMLTAMGEADDRIAGLERGADDYLPKPFEPRELVLRIRTILRRVPVEPTAPRELRFGAFEFDLARKSLRKGKSDVRLTASEADLLAALAQSPGVPVSREELGRRAGAVDGSRLIDVQITRLRRKIEVDPRFPQHIQTVRGRGYMLQLG